MAHTLLDLFAGAGGAARGYQQAGFHVTGVDHRSQPRYAGDVFIKADAFDYLADNWWKYDAFHASPPCQRYSRMTRCIPGLDVHHPDYIAKLRAWLDFYDKPYVIENVPEAPMKPQHSILLCGSMFGYDLYRHRLFEANFNMRPPPHPFHTKTAVQSSDWAPGLVLSVAGNCSPIKQARKIMGGMDWMTADELAESIPWYYCAYVGDFLRRRLERLARANGPSPRAGVHRRRTSCN
jgi:DNA (cytosine-5)-methyltransferase 1